MIESDAKRRTQSVWGSSPAGTTLAKGAAVGTREFFEGVLEKRAAGEMAWLPDVFPFDEVVGKRVLELGCGAGFDAYRFMTSGAVYTGVDITPENVERTRTHLGLYGLKPDAIQADAESLPFADGSFDIVFSNGVLHHTPDMRAAFGEALRVLKRGGEFWVTVYHRDSVFYWGRLALYDQIIKGGWRHQTLQERLARIEFTTSDELPLVRVLSRGGLRRLLGSSGFDIAWLGVRKLAEEDFPLVPGVGFVVRRIPLAVIDRLGMVAGWYVAARAVRPMTQEAQG
jgi:SAM-dependent methyltransferase